MASSTFTTAEAELLHSQSEFLHAENHFAQRELPLAEAEFVGGEEWMNKAVAELPEIADNLLFSEAIAEAVHAEHVSQLGGASGTFQHGAEMFILQAERQRSAIVELVEAGAEFTKAGAEFSNVHFAEAEFNLAEAEFTDGERAMNRAVNEYLPVAELSFFETILGEANTVEQIAERAYSQEFNQLPNGPTGTEGITGFSGELGFIRQAEKFTGSTEKFLINESAPELTEASAEFTKSEHFFAQREIPLAEVEYAAAEHHLKFAVEKLPQIVENLFYAETITKAEHAQQVGECIMAEAGELSEIEQVFLSKSRDYINRAEAMAEAIPEMVEAEMIFNHSEAEFHQVANTAQKTSENTAILLPEYLIAESEFLTSEAEINHSVERIPTFELPLNLTEMVLGGVEIAERQSFRAAHFAGNPAPAAQFVPFARRFAAMYSADLIGNRIFPALFESLDAAESSKAHLAEAKVTLEAIQRIPSAESLFGSEAEVAVVEAEAAVRFADNFEQFMSNSEKNLMKVMHGSEFNPAHGFGASGARNAVVQAEDSRIHAEAALGASIKLFTGIERSPEFAELAEKAEVSLFLGEHALAEAELAEQGAENTFFNLEAVENGEEAGVGGTGHAIGRIPNVNVAA